jgi:hypothetical protein
MNSNGNGFAVWGKMTKHQVDVIKKNYPKPIQWGDGYVLNYTYSKLGGTDYGNSKYYAVKILNSVNPEDFIGLFTNRYAFRTYSSKDSDIGKMVDEYEFKHSLTPKTYETFRDLINEL